MFTGWKGSDDAGSLAVILGEPTLETVSIKLCSGHQGGSIGGVDPNNSRQIFNRLFRLIQLEIDFAPQCIRLFLIGDPTFRRLGVEEFLQRRQRVMPRFGICLTAGLSCVYVDEALASDISKRIELKNLLVGSGSLVPLFQPREYIPFPNSCPYILAVECDGAIEVYPGFVQIVGIVQCLILLGESQ